MRLSSDGWFGTAPDLAELSSSLTLTPPVMTMTSTPIADGATTIDICWCYFISVCWCLHVENVVENIDVVLSWCGFESKSDVDLNWFESGSLNVNLKMQHHFWVLIDFFLCKKKKKISLPVLIGVCKKNQFLHADRNCERKSYIFASLRLLETLLTADKNQFWSLGKTLF